VDRTTVTQRKSGYVAFAWSIIWILTYFGARLISNGPTEAVYLLIKKILPCHHQTGSSQ